jgi:hypothetical protein
LNILTAKIKAPLQRSEEPGTNALNSYHLVGQLLALYSQAAKLNREDLLKTQWDAAEGILLENVGQLFDFWSALRTEGDYAVAPIESVVISNKIFRLSFRLSKIIKLAGEQTAADRLPSIILLCEKRWQAVVDEFKHDNPFHHAMLNSLLADSRQRSRTLRAMLIAHDDPGKIPTPSLDGAVPDGVDLVIEDF